MANLSLQPLNPADLPAFKTLLGGDDFGGCFCAVWTAHDETWAARCQNPSQPNYDITASRVLAGDKVGYLVYLESELVAWTGAGPKAMFPFLEKKQGSRLSASTDGIWSIGCMAIKEPFRDLGLSKAIVEAVLVEARSRGARRVEAYPTRPWDEPRSYRGSEAMYRRVGFQEVAAERDGEREILLMVCAL